MSTYFKQACHNKQAKSKHSYSGQISKVDMDPGNFASNHGLFIFS